MYDKAVKLTEDFVKQTFIGEGSGHEMYNPKMKPAQHKTTQQYITNVTHTINHFYEKLLLLKDLMNTKTAKKIAEKRHRFMELYLNEFYKEWDGEWNI